MAKTVVSNMRIPTASEQRAFADAHPTWVSGSHPAGSDEWTEQQLALDTLIDSGARDADPNDPETQRFEEEALRLGAAQSRSA